MAKSQTERNRTWRESSPENRARDNYNRAKAACKSFIRNKATNEDILDLEKIIEERGKILKNNIDTP